MFIFRILHLDQNKSLLILTGDITYYVYLCLDPCLFYHLCHPSLSLCLWLFSPLLSLASSHPMKHIKLSVCCSSIQIQIKITN